MPSYSLVVLNGSLPGTTVRLVTDVDSVTLGRHESRDLPLDDHRASRLHARVCFRAGKWHIEDCGSLNGTFVNSQPVQQAVLEPGDLVKIGDRLILFVKNQEDRNDSPLETSLLKSTTLLGKLPTGDIRSALVEQSTEDPMSRVVRDSAVLCRLANHLHQNFDTEKLVQVALDALVDGISGDVVMIWLIGADGRLRCAGQHGENLEDMESHVLASLAVERNKAFLVRDPNSSAGSKTVDDSDTASLGMALSVPISSQNGCRGAIECYRLPKHKMFIRSDLDFAIVVAYQMGLALENHEHRDRLELANEELRRRLASQTRLVGSGTAMTETLEQIGRVGPTAANVLILGESGTGKELVAQSIHELSKHSSGPYITVNCAAFSESLLESELFGHEAGAFTGADRRRIGSFERAHLGTIFLDEVGEMSANCQAKLLRVLEGHPFERVGGQESIRVDVRIISATHRDLTELVKQGTFREDLYYRLRVIDIKMPPLRERGDDVAELSLMFLEQFRKQVGRETMHLTPESIQALQAYPWPGNVRELKNAIERAVVLCRSDEVQPDDLGLRNTGNINPPAWKPQLMTLREAEKQYILHVLEQVDGNKTKAGKILGIGRGTLYKKLEDS